MTYSYTQIAHYLACPRRYRYRYLDGWKEKDNRAGMLFGRAFEEAVAAYFLGRDSAEVLFREWSLHRDQQLEYARGETWDEMLRQGFYLLDRFAQDDRVHIPQPRRNLQVKIVRPLGGNDFLAYLDAVGEIDGTVCVIDWKTASTSYPSGPADLITLDPQLIAYSWATGMPEVALVIFVRKRLVEIQYLRATISDAQRQEFQGLLQDTITQIEAAKFMAHSGIRFPQNACLACPFLGLCLNRHTWPSATRFAPRRPALVGLMSFRTKDPPMAPRLNSQRAQLLLAKIDQILAWRETVAGERDRRFIELGRYLCEVRAGQYWRLEHLKSFDEFLARRFPDSRRKAYYLMSIHEHLPRHIRHELPEIGWAKAAELAKVARATGDSLDCATWLHKAHAQAGIRRRGREVSHRGQ